MLLRAIRCPLLALTLTLDIVDATVRDLANIDELVRVLNLPQFSRLQQLHIHGVAFRGVRYELIRDRLEGSRVGKIVSYFP